MCPQAEATQDVGDEWLDVDEWEEFEMFGEDFVDLALNKSTAVDEDVPLRRIRKTVSRVRDIFKEYTSNSHAYFFDNIK